MDFMLGILTCVAFFLTTYVSYREGQKKSIRTKITPTDQEKKKQEKLQEFNEGINKVINYSVETAFKGVRK